MIRVGELVAALLTINAAHFMQSKALGSRLARAHVSDTVQISNMDDFSDIFEEYCGFVEYLWDLLYFSCFCIFLKNVDFDLFWFIWYLFGARFRNFPELPGGPFIYFWHQIPS